MSLGFVSDVNFYYMHGKVIIFKSFLCQTAVFDCIEEILFLVNTLLSPCNIEN